MKTFTMPDDPTDAELLRDFSASRNPEAFAGLVERHSRMVLGTAARRIPDRAEAEDVLQEVFVLLAEKAASLKPDHLGPWLHRVTVNVCRNHARRARVRRDILLQVQAQKNGLWASEEHAPDWESARPLLDEAIDALPGGHRRVIVMRFFERRRWRDIGLALGKSEDAARVLCSRAVERLGARLRHKGVGLPFAILTAGLGSLAGEAQAMPPTFAVMPFSTRILSQAQPRTVGVGGGFVTRWGAVAACFAAGAGLPILTGNPGTSSASPMPLPVPSRALPRMTGGPGAMIAASFKEAGPLSADDLISTLRSLQPWGNPVLIRVRVQRAMAALSGDDFHRVKDAWLSLPRTRQWYEAGEALFQRWGALDYPGAVAAIKEHKLTTFRGRIENTGYGFGDNAQDGWMSADPAAFLTYQAPEDEDVRSGDMGNKAGEYHPWSDCLRLADSIPDAEKREAFLWSAAESRLPRDHTAITAWAEEREAVSSANHSFFWEKWLKEWAWKDPSAAFEYARGKWPDAARSPWPEAITEYWARHDPGNTASAVAAWAGGEPDALRQLLGDWATLSPEECIPFVERMPVSQARDTLLTEMRSALEWKIVTEKEGEE